MTGDRPLVSVVIPCFNQAHFLTDSISSVLAQTHQPVEIVVVDDGSSDNTVAVVRRHPGVRVVRQENRGVALARNAGLRETSGEYVLFLDADDVLDVDAIAIGLGAFGRHAGCAMVFGHTSFLMEDRSPPPTDFRPSFGGDHYRQFLAGHTMASPASALYRRGVFDAVGGFDPTATPAEDYDLYCRIARRHPVHCHGQVVGAYRQHRSSASTSSRTMLRATVGVARRQRRFVWRRPTYWRAYRAGVRAWTTTYGEQIVGEVQRDVQERRWRDAARGFGLLLVGRPTWAAALVRSRARITPPATPYDPDPLAT